MTVYLDCNATTPLEPQLRVEVLRYLDTEYGNAGSRTHEYGTRAMQAIRLAREQLARAFRCQPEEVHFTSGATEANNLAILGLAGQGAQAGRRHLVSTTIEHKAVLEPMQILAQRGFALTLLSPSAGGWIDPEAVRDAVRADTLLVSIMHVNNETGVEQPLTEICEALSKSEAFFHVDAAQGFGKRTSPLRHERIDLVSISGHKIFAPKGIGALIARRRGFGKVPLEPLMYGGGQERGLRPGTLPVHLIVGLGLAAKLSEEQHDSRTLICSKLREQALNALEPLGALINGDQTRLLPHVLNLSFPGLDSEAVMLALKGVIACSNGSACTSASYQPSHVLKAMGLDEDRIRGAIRLSWCHLTCEIPWEEVRNRIRTLI